MVKKLNFTTVIWVLFYVFIFVYLLGHSFNYLDNDLGWHLKVGQDILNEHHVPNFDNYDFVLAGQTWVDHEWLINLISYLIYSKFGYIALNIFFVVIAWLAFFILAIFTRREYITEKTKGNGFIMILLLLGLMAAFPHLGVRMQEITFLFFILLLLIIYYYEKNQNKKILFWLPPLFVAWVNLHGGFLIGFAVLAFWVIIKIIEKILYKYRFFSFLDFNKMISYRAIAWMIAAAVFSAVSTLLNPYGLKLYLFLFDYKNTTYQSMIAEWLPFYYLPIEYWQLFYAAIAVSVLLVLFYFALKKERDNQQRIYKIELWQLLLTVIFLVLAFKSKRHFPLFIAATLPMIMGFLFRFLSIPDNLSRFLYKNNVIRFFVSATFILVIPFLFLQTNFTNSPFAANAAYCDYYPCQALQVIKNDSKLANLRIFNNYSWGGYLIWAWPGKQLFIDGRLPQYPFHGHTLLEEYLEFYDEKKTGEKLNEYNIELVFFKIDKPFQINWVEKNIFGFKEDEDIGMVKNNGLKKYLESAKEWNKVYGDAISEVYLRK